MMTKIPVKGLALDLDGVLYVGNKVIDGAPAALAELRRRGIPIRFVTNTTTRTPVELQQKLARMGFAVDEAEILTVVTATAEYLRGLGNPSCYLLVREAVSEAFSGLRQNYVRPDYVVIGDIGTKWDYETLNRVFNMLMRGSQLVCMHRNKYWQEEEGLRLDIGAFVAALEFVSGKTATVIGKPAPAFFEQVIASLELPANEIAMVGDDIESDVGGAQACGMIGVVTKTGKFRPELAAASSVNPDCAIASIADLPDLLV